MPDWIARRPSCRDASTDRLVAFILPSDISTRCTAPAFVSQPPIEHQGRSEACRVLTPAAHCGLSTTPTQAVRDLVPNRKQASRLDSHLGLNFAGHQTAFPSIPTCSQSGETQTVARFPFRTTYFRTKSVRTSLTYPFNKLLILHTFFLSNADSAYEPHTN